MRRINFAELVKNCCQVQYFVMMDHAGLKQHVRTRHRQDNILLSDVTPVHINGKEYRKYHKAGKAGGAGHRLALLQTYAEWYAYSQSNLFIWNESSGFSRFSLMRSFASRHELFPQFGVVQTKGCSTIGREACHFMGRWGNRV